MTDSKTNIPFTKMQGAGNDFVVLDNRDEEFTEEDLVALAPRICNRKYGVGSDGIMALMPPQKEDMDYTMFYRNPDGSDAGMCGNGARCLALFAHSLGFDAQLRFNVHDQFYEASVNDKGTVRVSFPMESSVNELAVREHSIYQIHTGTEHIVLETEAEMLENEDHLREEGSLLRHHQQFAPKGTNVNFICGTDPASLKLQTFERGVEDLTLACGTGAIASALIWHHLQDQASDSKPFKVETEGGILRIYFSYNPATQIYSNIKLEGPAQFVFTGEFFN